MYSSSQFIPRSLYIPLILRLVGSLLLCLVVERNERRSKDLNRQGREIQTINLSVAVPVGTIVDCVVVDVLTVGSLWCQGVSLECLNWVNKTMKSKAMNSKAKAWVNQAGMDEARVNQANFRLSVEISVICVGNSIVVDISVGIHQHMGVFVY